MTITQIITCDLCEVRSIRVPPGFSQRDVMDKTGWVVYYEHYICGDCMDELGTEYTRVQLTRERDDADEEAAKDGKVN